MKTHDAFWLNHIRVLRDLVTLMVGVFAMVFVLTACQNKEQAEQEPIPATQKEEQAEQDTTAATISGDTLGVTLREYVIEMPSTLPAGRTVLKVTNEGQANHNIEFERDGFEKKFAEVLKPGESQTMEIDLQSGTYYVYCPVGNHEAYGMAMELTVTEFRE